MRLTVHHSAELLPYWLDSLNKLLATDGLNRDKLLNAGHWHVATFNDRIVGLAVTKDEELIYFAVRDGPQKRQIAPRNSRSILRAGIRESDIATASRRHLAWR